MTDDDRNKYRPGKTARKFYLSDEAIAILHAASERTTYAMGVIVDMLIKEHGPELGRPPYKPGDVHALIQPEVFDAYKGSIPAIDKAIAQVVRHRVEPPAVAEVRARKAALDRGIDQAKQALKTEPQKKDFDFDADN